jgi:molybdenum cofactor cytidylyltransferase
MKSTTLGAVILAAGGATRFGAPKQLALFQGESLVRKAARTALIAECSPVVIVCGKQIEAIETILEDLPVKVVLNTRWNHGIGTSICRGVEAALEERPAPSALVLMTCDQPFVTPRTISCLAAAAAATNRSIAASSYGNSLGIPAFFHANWFSTLRQLPAQAGAKCLLTLHREQVTAVDFPEGAYDIDCPGDLERFAALPSYPNDPMRVGPDRSIVPVNA